MKKLLLVIAAVAMLLPSCQKINDELDALGARLDKLENTTISTINEQIANINTSIAELEAADVELKNYITALQGTAAELQKSIEDTNTKIDEVKTALQVEISTAKADVLAQLEALRTEMNNELAQINSTIATLQAKDTELEGKITELRNYVDTELKNTKDWATATFSTLEQYNALCSEIATIKTQIENLNKSLSELETRFNTKIATDIATAVKGLQGELAETVTEITNAYTSAISTAKEEITAAYTAAIQSAISTLESSMKQWVNEQLAKYYTIAQIDAMLATMEQETNSKLEAQKVYLEGLISTLSEELKSLINTNNVAIEELKSKVSNLETSVANNASKIIENSSNIAKNAQAIATNSSNIEECQTAVVANAKLIADIKSAVEALQSSTIAKNVADIATNAENITKNAELITKNAVAINNNAAAIAQNSADIVQLQQRLGDFENEMEEICQRIIRDAISNNGAISSSEALALSTRIDNEISTFNYQISLIATRVSVVENEVSAIKEQIASLLADIIDLKDSISALLSRIQSISYIPKYEDGKATVNYDGVTSCISLDFEVSPKDAVSELAKVWQSAITVKAIYTRTRAVAFIDMPIEVFEADASSGVISLKVSGENLSQSFFDGTQTASVRLSISDGNSSVTSEYIALEIQTIMEYTTSDGQIVTPYNDYSVISNTYTNGVGKMVFSGRLTKINEYFCQRCTTLTSVTIPASVKIIGVNAFQGCSELSVVNMLSAPPVLEGTVFSGVASNCKVYVPYAYIPIYKSAKSWSTYRSKIYDPASDTKTIVYTSSDGAIVTPYDSSLFGANITDNTYTDGQGVITFDGEVSAIGNEAFKDCITLTSITIPNSVSSIGRSAFYGCSGLTKVGVINCSVGSSAFRNCSNLKCVYFGENAKITSSSFGYLSEIYFTCTTPPEDSNMWDDEEMIFYVPYDNKTKIYVPLAAIDTYKTTGYWSDLSHLYVAY